jgi:hypothetical protein
VNEEELERSGKKPLLSTVVVFDWRDFGNHQNVGKNSQSSRRDPDLGTR